MASLQIKIPEKLIPVFEGPADVRGSYGGRGSGKTFSFALMMAVRGYMYGKAGIRGQLLCTRQFMNSLDDSTLEECKRAIQNEPTLNAYYDVGDKYIKSKDGRIWFAFAGLDRNIASIKSKGRILICWTDEAEPVTDTAWQTLIPTLREEGEDWNAELWVTWNPLRKTAPVEKRFRFANDALIKVVELNWRDNPKFPEKLERERQRDLKENPEQYEHIWEGGYISVNTGAYYAKQLIAARTQGRIGRVSHDPLMTIRAFWDIGGTGAKADACAIFMAQFIGKEIRIFDHYEAVGQPLAAHVNWLRSSGYDGCLCVLPHDGEHHDKIESITYEGALKKAGFRTMVVKNQGAGAAFQRVESARRLFPAMWFDAERCEAGIDAIGWYHEKRDDKRGIGLGPNHDWSSHSADAFGLMAVSYEQLTKEKRPNTPPVQPFRPSVTGMGY